MTPLILDHRPAYLPSSWAGSLLTLPLGARTVLAHLVDRLGPELARALRVLPTFPVTEEYEVHLRARAPADLKVVDGTQLATEYKSAEPADYLIVVDPSRWPIEGLDLETVLRRHTGYRGATHAVAIGADDERTRERVELDGEGRVRRVQRLYDQVSWPEVAASSIVLSVVPTHAVRDIQFSSLAALRSALAAKGVLSRDDAMAWDFVDLAEEHGLIAVNEWMLRRALRRDSHPGFSRQDGEALVGQSAHLHPSARLVGPVIVHNGARIEQDVTVIGPTVVGSACRVERGATIAQSVLIGDTVVSAGVTIRHSLASGQCSGSPDNGNAAAFTAVPSAKLVGGYQRVEGDPPPQTVQADIDRRHGYLAAKRTVDLVLSVSALIVLSPLLVCTAILVKLTSRGPVLFIHGREARGGKEFPCLKFRTMAADAHLRQRELLEQNEVDGPQFMIKKDPRITLVGKFMRSTNIDELPQLINVALGHMSLIGPRPSPFRENQICVPWRRARLSVRPGVTGLWQICRDNRSAGDFDQWIYYDMLYVRHLSAWHDIKILTATVLSLGGLWSVPLRWLISDNERRPRRAVVSTAG